MARVPTGQGELEKGNFHWSGKSCFKTLKLSNVGLKAIGSHTTNAEHQRLAAAQSSNK